jgi:hypothetical protein
MVDLSGRPRGRRTDLALVGCKFVRRLTISQGEDENFRRNRTYDRTLLTGKTTMVYWTVHNTLK